MHRLSLQKQHIKEYIISTVLYFQHVLKFLFSGNMIATVIGNLDPFYLLAPLYVWQNRKNAKALKRFFIFFAPFAVYGIIQICIFRQANVLKLFTTIVKIGICLLCTMYIVYSSSKINFLLISKMISVMYAVSLPFALLFKESSLFWVTNDLVNKYTTTRLRLLYYEPSELGFRIAIVVVILLGFLIISKNLKEQIILAILLAMNALALYMSRSMGAICIGILAVFVMFLFDAIARRAKTRIRVYTCILIAGVALAVILIAIQSPIYMRLVDTINGKDFSNNYRIALSYNVLKDGFNKYYGLGCGFGNVNTDVFISQYKDWGMVTVITNSFVYYIVETGIFGIITLGILLTILVKRCIQSKSAVKWGLLVFVVIFQFVGGYFTNALNWIVYGIILSNFDENKILNKRKYNGR